MRFALLLLALALVLCTGCTRNRDGTVTWHSFGGKPGARSAAAHDLLNEEGATYRGTPGGNPFRPIATP